MLGRCDLLPLVQAWDEWWPDATRLASKCHGVSRHLGEPRSKKKRLAQLQQEHQALSERLPSELDLAGMTVALKLSCEDDFERYFSMTARALGHVRGPLAVVPRVGLLLQLHRLRTPGMWWEAGRFPAFLRALAADLAAASDGDDHFAPWRTEVEDAAARGAGVCWAMEDLLDQGLEPRDIGRFFAAQAWLREHAPQLDRQASCNALVSLLEALHDGELAARLWVSLHRVDRHERWCDADALRAAWMVAEPVVDVFPQLFRFFDDLAEPAEMVVPAIRSVLEIVGEDRVILRALTLEVDISALVSCGRKLAALTSLKVSLPAASIELDPGERTWIAEYPEQLHDELERLSRITVRARSIAAKVLRSVHRGKATIEAELRAVEAMLAEASTERRAALRKRQATLRERLASYEQPRAALSPIKLDKLKTKLRRRGGLALLTALEEAADELLRPALAARVGVEDSTPWLLDERVVTLLAPVAIEAKATRRLFDILLGRRATDLPWDLRDHPANAAFLDKLRASSIDPGPWIDGVGEVVVDTSKGPLHLRLEDDPIEIFHMGRHFGTCLSPGHFNFFSAITNAADINKRVLYARDERGRVQGRRLVCLTQDGSILPFHCYAHDEAYGFEEHSAAFVRQLAEAMGTSLVARGPVPKLVATRWYDDGPVDITGRFAELKEQSKFRTVLTCVRPDRLPALLMEAFGRSQIDEGLAPMLLELPELSDRPELAEALIPLLRHPDRLPVATCLRACRLLLRAGAVDRVRSYFVQPMAHALWRCYCEYGEMDPEIVAFLARCAPSEALRLLRRTRHRGVRSWNDETVGGRLLAAGIAMEGLRRRSQAKRLYGLALERKPNSRSHTHQEAKRRLTALEGKSAAG